MAVFFLCFVSVIALLTIDLLGILVNIVSVFFMPSLNTVLR